MSRPPFAFLSVVAVVTAGLAVGAATQPGTARPGDPRATPVRPVVGKVVVCPELLRSGSDVVTRLTAGTVEDGPVTVRAAKLVPAPTGGLGDVVLDEGGHVGRLNIASDTSVAVAVTASGERAGGLEVEQLSRGADGPQRGLANTRCEPTAQDTWFVGGSTRQYAEAELVLVNPYDENALVNLEIYGNAGEVVTSAAEGLLVPPRGRKVVKMSELAPDEHALAVRVVTIEGRISPAMRDSRARGELPQGADWIPRAGEPSTQVDLAGVPPGIGRRLLYLFAPGETDAVVRVQVTNLEGQHVPVGLEEVDVAAGKVRVVDLTEILGVVDQRTADRVAPAVHMRIAAEGAPVLASAFAENNARFSGIREFAYVGPTPALTGPSLITENRTDHKLESTIYLAAPDGEARISVQIVPLRGVVPGNLHRKVYRIPAGKLVALPVHLQFPIGDPRPLLITPLEGSAPIYAGRMIYERGNRGPLMTVLSLVTQQSSGLPVARVEHDLDTALVDPRSAEES